MLLLICRVGYIQLINGTGLQKIAVEQWTNDVKIDAKRGKILDIKGSELAISANCERVDAYIRDIKKIESDNKNIKSEIAAKLSSILGDKSEDILKKLNSTLSNGNPINSVTIKRRIEKSQADEIRKLKLPGIIVSEDSKRYYLNANFLSDVLGFTNIDGDGQEGIELKYNKQLKGAPGRRIMEADPYNREMPYNISKYIEPVNGNDIVLNINESIQLYVEKAIEEALITTKAKAVTAIVMDPTTGGILAMADKPDFNPNNPRDMKNFTDFQDVVRLWNNRAVTYTFEPGSTFKALTASAALSEGLVSDNDRFSCPGFKKVADRIIKCWKTSGHGIQDISQILQNSCNVGFMALGDKLGRDKMYKYIDAFGFTKPTNIDVNFEESGFNRPLNKVGPVELATLSFGQGISVTPMQMVSLYATIANNGKMMEPHLVNRIQNVDKNGNITVIKDIQPKMVRQAIDESVAKKMKAYLEKVITLGASKKAYVDGYHIGGKTGTAQKAENGRYIPGKYVSSFGGFAPVDNPKFVIFVLIDEPDPSNYYAGQITAPVAGRIFKDIFASLNIEPDKNSKNVIEVTIPNVVGMSQNEAVNKLKIIGLESQIKGKGTTVSEVLPKPGISVNSGSKVILYMGNGENYDNKVIMPNLDGKNVKEVTTLVNSLGLKVMVSGEGYAIDQEPSVGKELTKGTTVNVDFSMYGD